MSPMLDLNDLTSHCKDCGDIHPKLHCSRRIVFSVSGHLFQFSLAITVLFTQRLPNLCSQISSPWTCSPEKAAWPAKPELNYSWSNVSPTRLALAPFNPAQPGVRLLRAPSRGEAVADRRQAKRGSSPWGEFWCVTVCEQGKWPQQETFK